MKLKKVCVCGHFGIGKNLLNGQTIKTKILTNELIRVLGAEEVCQIDTHGGKKKIIELPFVIFSKLKTCRNIVILPAHNGLRVIAPVLFCLNSIFRRKLHYVVIGGWLPSFLEERPILKKILKKFDSIYVETNTMQSALDKQGFKNIKVMPNCKELSIVEQSQLKYVQHEPFKLCTFSRVMRKKGIEDAVEAVKSINEQSARIVYTLDIYGQVDNMEIDWFEKLQEEFPDYIQYKGMVPFDKSVEVLKEYYALLFPTLFYTEGIPGTIIDGYAAGVPVISAKWESFSDIVEDHITGIGYEFASRESLKQLLVDLAEKPELLWNMKNACINKAVEFLPMNAMKGFINDLE